MKNNPNPKRSTVLESMLILAKLDSSYAPLVQQLQKNQRLLQQADAQLQGKLYADKSVNWLKLNNYIAEPATYGISSSANQVLMLLIGSMAQGNNLIQVSNPVICHQLHIAKNTCISAIKELISGGYIAIYQQPKRHEATIYMINPRVATCGKAGITLQHTYDDLAEPEALIAFQDAHKKNQQLLVGHKWTEEQGHTNRQRYNTLEIQKKEEPSD